MARLQASQISLFSFPLPNRLLTIELVVSEKAKIAIKKQVLILLMILAIAKGRSHKCSIAMKNKNHCEGNNMD